ncbi:Lar family restriction alleviation protein [Pseudomonas denitrificans (nom. rej.)]|uniref:Lar family restriction alleviation protein n=1 Tax=Pseudomonas denitrificans TaxID=43306 RepID=UPI00142EF8A8|nr:Lar family restriction alleviation protein [Pseudomonas denitrificans (nom. rej.)]
MTLKPCAFCGGPPVPFVQLADQGFGSAPRLDDYGDDGLSVEAFVFCHECGAQGPSFEDEIFDASSYDQAMAEGVRLWQDRDGRHADLYEANAEQNLFPRLEKEEMDE